MPFCANCGSQVEGRFCAKCGASVGAPPAGGAPQPQPGTGYPPPNPGYQPPPGGPPPIAGAQTMSDNAASALCYALGFITGILFLILAPYNQNRTVRFHAFQSIFLNVAIIVIWIAIRIFDGLLWGIGAWWAASMISFAYGLCCFALWIVMIVMTYQGRTPTLPVISGMAQQQA